MIRSVWAKMVRRTSQSSSSQACERPLVLRLGGLVTRQKPSLLGKKRWPIKDRQLLPSRVRDWPTSHVMTSSWLTSAADYLAIVLCLCSKFGNAEVRAELACRHQKFANRSRVVACEQRLKKRGVVNTHTRQNLVGMGEVKVIDTLLLERIDRLPRKASSKIDRGC